MAREGAGLIMKDYRRRIRCSHGILFGPEILSPHLIRILTAAIAAGAAVIGASVAATASYFNTKHKLKELELAASQRLRENYLSNAREYTTIYVPIILSIS